MKNELVDGFKRLVEETMKLPAGKRTQLVFQLETELKKLQLGNGDSVDGFIFSTSNPAQFGTIHGNRIVNEDSIYTRELATSMRNIGNVSPVIINEKGEVADGQRRIAAVQKFGLEIPIRYTYYKGANIDTVGDINRLQFKWTFKDWMHKYVSKGINDYVEYEEINKRYEKYMRGRSLRSLLMNCKVESFKSDIWERGMFQINREMLESNIHFLDFLSKVYLVGEEDNIFAKDRNFQKALYDLYKNVKNFDENKLLRKIRLGFNRLNIKTDFIEYRKILLELYYGKRQPKIKNEEEVNQEALVA